jgi:hypothetical protein
MNHGNLINKNASLLKKLAFLFASYIFYLVGGQI